jgi:hypothetical protein
MRMAILVGDSAARRVRAIDVALSRETRVETSAFSASASRVSPAEAPC